MWHSMKTFREKAMEGTNVENVYRHGYIKGREEQLEQDVSMIEGLVENSVDCRDFMENLSVELDRIRRNLRF